MFSSSREAYDDWCDKQKEREKETEREREIYRIYENDVEDTDQPLSNMRSFDRPALRDVLSVSMDTRHVFRHMQQHFELFGFFTNASYDGFLTRVVQPSSILIE